MPTHNGRSHGFVKDSLEQAQQRLEAFEHEAAEILAELRTKSKASRKEIGGLLEKFQAGDLFKGARSTERKLEKDLKARANKISGELSERLTAVADAILRFVGVASREQVEELVGELERLSKRLEKLSKSRPAPKKKTPRGNSVDA